jgi:ankyrin repeat protein
VTVQLLLQEGAKVADIDSNTNLTPLAAAIREKHDEIAEVLFPRDLDSTGVALSNAMQYNRPEWARRIIQRYKSLPDSKDAFLIALCFCKRYHDPSVVQALFENKNLHIPLKDLVREFKKLCDEISDSLDREGLECTCARHKITGGTG